MTLINVQQQPELLSWLQGHRRRSAAELRLLEFTKQAWHQVEPGPLDINWHVECICEHLEAV
jgi:hypothetical protein